MTELKNFFDDFYTLYGQTIAALGTYPESERFFTFLKKTPEYKAFAQKYPDQKDLLNKITSDISFFRNRTADLLCMDPFSLSDDPLFEQQLEKSKPEWMANALGKLALKMPERRGDFYALFLEEIKEASSVEQEFYEAFDAFGKNVPPDEVRPLLFQMIKVIQKDDRKALPWGYQVLGNFWDRFPEERPLLLKCLREQAAFERNSSQALWELSKILKKNAFFKKETGDIPKEFKELYPLRFLNEEEFLCIVREGKWKKKEFGSYQKGVHLLLQAVINDEDKKSLTSLGELCSLTDEVFPTATHYVSNVLKFTSYASCFKDLSNLLSSASDLLNYKTREELLEDLKRKLSKRRLDCAAFRRDPQSCTTYQLSKDWLVPCAIRAVDIFGDGFGAYLKKTAPFLSPHDAVQFLPMNPMPPEKLKSLACFLQKNVLFNSTGVLQVRPIKELSAICQGWNKLSEAEEKQSYQDVLSIVNSVQYKNVRYPLFAAEAARWSVPDTFYSPMEAVYEKGLSVPALFDVDKRFKVGSWSARFLPREDVRTIFFGKYTDCCQHFFGQGKACAIASVKEPDSQLFVVEREGKIVAGSWVWQNTVQKGGQPFRAVCFDNIEALGELKFRKELMDLYHQAADYLAKEENVRLVTIGMGCQDGNLSGLPDIEAVPFPKSYGDTYTDATRQVLLLENTRAESINARPAFVRHVCSRIQPIEAQTMRFARERE